MGYLCLSRQAVGNQKGLMETAQDDEEEVLSAAYNAAVAGQGGT